MPMSLSKKMSYKGTLRQMFYLFEAPSSSCDPILPPLHTVYTCIQNTYSHREGVRGGESYPERRLEGQTLTKPVENTNMTDSISSLYKLCLTPVKTTIRVWCLYSYLVHACTFTVHEHLAAGCPIFLGVLALINDITNYFILSLYSLFFTHECPVVWW
jgi:hypothetical protein